MSITCKAYMYLPYIPNVCKTDLFTTSNALSSEGPLTAEKRKFPTVYLNSKPCWISMHSSMMRTARLLTVSCSIGVGGGWGLPREGVSTGGGLPHRMLGYTLLWTEFLTYTCENIAFPQLLLRAVNIVTHRSLL